MNINIRNGVYETNSSSMHSIAIRKNHSRPSNKDMERDSNRVINGIYKVECGENIFGRHPFRVLTSVIEKALYIIAHDSVYNIESPRDINSILEDEIYPVIREFYPTFEKFNFPNDWYSSSPDYGEIDHQSYDILDKFRSKYPDVSIKEFLTDSAYVIVIDGDEYCYFSSMLEDGVVDRQDFSDIIDW